MQNSEVIKREDVAAIVQLFLNSHVRFSVEPSGSTDQFYKVSCSNKETLDRALSMVAQATLRGASATKSALRAAVTPTTEWGVFDKNTGEMLGGNTHTFKNSFGAHVYCDRCNLHCEQGPQFEVREVTN